MSVDAGCNSLLENAQLRGLQREYNSLNRNDTLPNLFPLSF